jgi:hypothetical protein
MKLYLTLEKRPNYPTPFIALAPPSVLRSIVQHGDGFRGDPVGHKSFHQVVEPVLAVLDLNFLFVN